MPYNERNPGADDAGASGNDWAWQSYYSPNDTPYSIFAQRYGGPAPIGQIAAEIVAVLAQQVRP